MKKARKPTLPAPGYVLSEEQHLQLQKLRNHWLLLAELTSASTLEEEQTALHISRPELRQCFESAALQLQTVLEATLSRRELRKEISQHQD